MATKPLDRTMGSRLVRNDDGLVQERCVPDLLIRPGTITFLNWGTAPSVVQEGDRFTVTSGTGAPTSGAEVTIPHNLGAAPSRVWLVDRTTSVKFFVKTVDATNIVIGVKNAPAVSTAYGFEMLVE